MRKSKAKGRAERSHPLCHAERSGAALSPLPGLLLASPALGSAEARGRSPVPGGTGDTSARRAPSPSPSPSALPASHRNPFIVRSSAFGFVSPSLAATKLLQRKRKRERSKRPVQGTMISFLNEKQRSKGGPRSRAAAGNTREAAPLPLVWLRHWGYRDSLGSLEVWDAASEVEKAQPKPTNKQTKPPKAKQTPKPRGDRKATAASGR